MPASNVRCAPFAACPRNLNALGTVAKIAPLSSFAIASANNRSHLKLMSRLPDDTQSGCRQSATGGPGIL